jgi:predicted metal-dependent enzyme (double-stranded beta helix superfamily)
MTDAEQPEPELYREIAAKLKEMADQSHLPDVQQDLRELAARFEWMAAHYDAQGRRGAARA